MYKFDASTISLVFVEEQDPIFIEKGGNFDFGGGDLSIDAGSRTDDTSVVDQGLR